MAYKSHTSREAKPILPEEVTRPRSKTTSTASAYSNTNCSRRHKRSDAAHKHMSSKITSIIDSYMTSVYNKCLETEAA
jgi:hypothetical protein